MTTTPADNTNDLYAPLNTAPLYLIDVGIVALIIGNIAYDFSKQAAFIALGSGVTAMIVGILLTVMFAFVHGAALQKKPGFDMNEYKRVHAARKEARDSWAVKSKRAATYLRAQSLVVCALWLVVAAGSMSGEVNQHYAAAAAGVLMIVMKGINFTIAKVTKRPRR